MSIINYHNYPITSSLSSKRLKFATLTRVKQLFYVFYLSTLNIAHRCLGKRFLSTCVRSIANGSTNFRTQLSSWTKKILKLQTRRIILSTIHKHAPIGKVEKLQKSHTTSKLSNTDLMTWPVTMCSKRPSHERKSISPDRHVAFIISGAHDTFCSRASSSGLALRHQSPEKNISIKVVKRRATILEGITQNQKIKEITMAKPYRLSQLIPHSTE